jgi:hypothetical protein
MMSLSPLATSAGCLMPARRVRDAPFGEGVELGVAGGEGDRLVAILRAGEDALDELPTFRDALGAALEEQVQQVLGALHVGRGHRQHFRGPTVESLASLRSGAGEHDPAHELWPDQGELLGDEAADRVPEHVERRDLPARRRTRARHGPSR